MPRFIGPNYEIARDGQAVAEVSTPVALTDQQAWDLAEFINGLGVGPQTGTLLVYRSEPEQIEEPI